MYTLEVQEAKYLYLIPVLQNRLYLARHEDFCLSDYLSAGTQTRIMKTHQSFVYLPFCADFGPLNFGMTSVFCKMMSKALQDSQQHVHIIYCANKSKNARTTTNAVFLLGAFLMLSFSVSAVLMLRYACPHPAMYVSSGAFLNFGVSPDEAWAPFRHMLSTSTASAFATNATCGEALRPYRDAS